MAYIHISNTRGRTIDDFRAVSAQHKPPQDIDGLLGWAAGSDDSGLHVVSIWRSRADKDRFQAEQLLPVFQAMGMADVVSDSEFTEYEAGEFYLR